MANDQTALDTPTLKGAIGLGVAGNFAGHLEQAGEAGDFVGVEAEAGAPKGVFPFYVPGLTEKSATGDPPHPLSVFPISSSQTVLPAPGLPGLKVNDPENISDLSKASAGGGNEDKSSDSNSGGGGGGFQVEPEIGLWCRLIYEEQGDQRVVKAIEPVSFGAFNDCSHRRPGASKISQKKNWGPGSKGFATDQLIPIDRFTSGGVMDHYRLASFLKRGQELIAYGEDSSVAGYGYMYEQLLDWLVDKLNHQPDAGPLESIAAHLKSAGYPPQAVIAIGATRYTDFGESHRLEPGEVSYVVAYDHRKHDLKTVQEFLLTDPQQTSIEGISMLRQEAVAQG